MAKESDVYVRLKLDSKDFKKKINEAEKDIKDFEEQGNESNDTIGAMTLGMAAFGAAAIAAGVALITVTKQLADGVFEAERYANRLDISTKSLLNLQSAGKDFGVEAEDVSEGLKNMTERLGEALLEGRGATFDALTKLGVDLKEIESLSTEDRLFKIAGALSEVESKAERTFLTMEVFQEEGFKMAEMLELGEEGLKDYVKQQDKFTDAINIDGLKEYRSEWNKTEKIFGTLTNSTANFFLPALTSLNKTIRRTILGLQGIHESDIIPDKTLERIKAAEKALSRIRGEEIQDQSFEKMRLEEEKRILAENKAGQLTIEQQEKINEKYRARKKLADETRDSGVSFMEIAQELTNNVIDATNDEVQANIASSNMPSLSPRFAGLLERGSQAEVSARGGEANEMQKQQTQYLKEIAEAQKKRERQFKINNVSF